MFCLPSVTLTLAALGSLVPFAQADVVLTKKIMDLALDSAKLSAIAYDTFPLTDLSGFDYINNYLDEPDQALVAKKDGYCFAVFRGTTMTVDDWAQNFKLGTDDICTSSTENKQCCVTRSGFYEAYYTSYMNEFESDLRACAKECKEIDECVVVTGHSQGGALAALGGIRFTDLNPYVFTFGQPPTIDIPCKVVDSERWYRFVNTKETEFGTIGITYDPVPFAPGLGTDLLGHMIILGADTQHVAYIGLDANDKFSPVSQQSRNASQKIN